MACYVERYTDLDVERDVYDVLVNNRCICDISNENIFINYLSSLQEIESTSLAPKTEFRDSLLVKTSVIRVLDELINGGKTSCFKIIDAVWKFRTKITNFLISLVVTIKDRHLKYGAIIGLLSIFRITNDFAIIQTFCDSLIEENDKFDFLIKCRLSLNTKSNDEAIIDGCQNVVSKRKDAINLKNIIDLKMNKLNEWLNSSRIMSLMTNDSFIKFWLDTIQTIRRNNLEIDAEKLPKITHLELLISVSNCIETVKLLEEIISTKDTPNSIQQKTTEILLEQIEKGWLTTIKIENYDNYFIGTYKSESAPKIDEFVNSVDVSEVAFLVLSSLNTYSYNSNDLISNVVEILSKWLKTYAKFQESDCWLVQLFIEQDDKLITAMLYCTQIYINLKQHPCETLNPHFVFIKFLEAIEMDPETLVDFLSSIETNNIIIFFVKYLKLVISEWDKFKKAHEDINLKHDDDSSDEECYLDATMTTLIRLRLKLERLESKNLFPYKIKPLCKLIKQCENLYEQ